MKHLTNSQRNWSLDNNRNKNNILNSIQIKKNAKRSKYIKITKIYKFCD